MPRAALEQAAARSGRYLGLLGPGLVLLVATILRFVNIGSPGVLIFDETFYVKDAWTLVHLGYEANWPASTAVGKPLDVNGLFQAGQVNIYTHVGEYIAHPPLGKWIIGLGELLAGGAQNPISWRVSVAVIGVLAVALVMLVAHRLFATQLVTLVAGGLMAIDNQAIVMSRVALLDNMVMFFALAAFWCVLEDRGLDGTPLRPLADAAAARHRLVGADAALAAVAARRGRRARRLHRREVVGPLLRGVLRRLPHRRGHDAPPPRGHPLLVQRRPAEAGVGHRR